MPPDILSTQEFERLLVLYDEANLEYTPPTDTPFVRLLAGIDRAHLFQLMTEQHYHPGEVICWEGDRGDAMYLIRAGRVVVVKGSMDAPTIIVDRGPGETIGEMALLEDQPRSATLVALDDVRVMQISREAFHTWLNGSPEVGITLMATLSSRLRSAANVHTASQQGKQQLVQQVNQLKDENEQLLELQRLRQETSDLIVHDLRNPLGVIYGSINMLELVLPENIYRENQELLGLASAACERMQRLVDSLLDVAKFTTGEMPMVLSEIQLEPLLEETAYRQSVAAQTRGVQLVVAVREELPWVLVDTEKMERVLTNLLDNALKYSPNNSQITIAAELQPQHIVVSIIDQGPGIPADQRKRIFERFAQVSDNQSPRRSGFGLGLTFCKLTIEAHGGAIWVEPGPNGKGSCFAFTLPLQ